jgi:hypothetical protein
LITTPLGVFKTKEVAAKAQGISVEALIYRMFIDQRKPIMTKLEELKAACEAAQGAYYAETAAYAAGAAAWDAVEAKIAAWDAYYYEVKKQENSND